MKIAARDIESFVKAPPAKALAILVYGPDEGLVRERIKLLTTGVVADPNDAFNVADISGDKLKDNPALMLDEAQSISMLGGRRVVRVRGGDERTVASAAKDALAALKKGDNLVLIEGGELGPRSALRLLFEGADNAAAVPCYVEDARDISRVIATALREAGYRINADALALFSGNVSGDRAIARGEVEKLITYMGPMKDIGPDDVTACVGGAAVLPMDDLARHTCAGRFAEADRILNFVLSEGANAVAVLRSLQNYYMRLHMVKSRMSRGEPQEAAMKRLRPAVFFKHKADYQTALHQLTAERMAQALGVIASAEARCKQTGSNPDIVVGRALLALSQMSARARRRA